MQTQADRAIREQPGSLPARFLRHSVPLLVFLVLAIATMLAVYWFFDPGEDSIEAVAVEMAEDVDFVRNSNALLAPIAKPKAPEPVLQRLAQSPPPIRVGIIAGHRGFDSGAACADGFTEAQINSALAERVVANLTAAGINAETLDEFDPRLDGYSATALVSIHSDSCDYINDLATGFKISGSSITDSSSLSICVEQYYRDATQLPYHPNSITPHMTDYHAFREIAPGTPAIIIEVGFLNLDREMLTNGSDQVVKGLTDGILCFLEKES